MEDEVDENKVEYKPASIRDLMRYASKFDWFLLITGLSFGALNGIIAPLILIVNLKLIGSLLTAQSEYENEQIDMDKFTHGMVVACLQYLAVAASMFTAGFISTFTMCILSQRQVRRIQQKFLIHVLNQDMAWLDQNQVGSLIEKVSAYMDRIKDGTSDKIIVILQALFTLLSGIVVGFVMNVKLAAVTLSIAPLVILSLWASTNTSNRLIRKERETQSKASSIAEQVLHGIFTVLAFNAQDIELKRYSNHLNSSIGIKKAIITSALNGAYKFVLFGSMGLSFWYGTTLVISGELAAPVVMALYWTIIVGAIRVGFAIPHIDCVIGARLAAGEIFSIIDRKPEMDCSSASGLKPVDVKGQLSFQDLHFNYPSRPDTKVLDGISFNVQAGQKIALVGHSGCGKSTIISLLMRFYQPEKGQITLDGRSIDDLNVEWLRNSIGIVSQEPVIFAGSIEENLRMGKEDLTQEEMENACQMANAEEFIKKLPNGYKTLIGDGNIRLSGGQKQRLAIARALVRNPKILLLDEATSSLDNESERLVQQGLEQASSGRTTIIIAHRLSTIKDVDKIFVFESGKLVEEGGHSELMELQDGVYKRLVLAQAIDQLDNEEGDVIEDQNDQNEHSQPASPIHTKKAWQSDDDNLMTSISLIDSKDKNNKFDMNNKLTDLKAEKKTKPATFLQIYRFAQNEQKFVWFGFISTMLQGAAWPIYTLIYGLLFKTLSRTLNSSNAIEELESQNIRNGLFSLGLGVFGGLFRFTSGSIFGYIGEVVSEKMRIAVFRNILRQDGDFFDHPDHSSGNLMTRLTSDAPNVQSAIDERLSDILQAFWTLVYGIMMACYFDWRMTLIEIGIVGLICGFQIVMLEILKRRTMKDSQLGEKAVKIASEAIGQIRTVQSLNRQEYFHSDFCTALSAPYSSAMWSVPLQSTVFGLSCCCEEINFVLTYLAGLLMIRGGYASPFIVFQVIENVNIGLLICGIPLAAYVPYYTQALASAGLMFKMINTQSGIDSMDDQGKRPEIEGNVQMKDVKFAYPRNQDNLVLRGLKLEALAGKSLALVGPSGSGKTTIISLMERFYDIQQGQISIDNNEIRDLNIKHLRKNLSIVGQEPTLFNLSIEENISYGIVASKEEVIKSAKIANIHDFIKSLPKGYETMLGSRGMQLSGGQRQRISIARAIIRDPKILLLDEATSSLDTQSEKLVQESLERASHGRTSIIIAHRLSTIQHADVIAVVKDGRVLEHGSHQQLLNRKGLYSKLVLKQSVTH